MQYCSTVLSPFVGYNRHPARASVHWHHFLQAKCYGRPPSRHVILDVIAKGTSQSIKEIIKEQLQKQRDPKKRLSTALHYLSTAVELEELVGEIAAESWSYIQGNRPWEAGGYASLDALKEDIYFDHILKATIERSKTVTNKKGKEILGILQHWHCYP